MDTELSREQLELDSELVNRRSTRPIIAPNMNGKGLDQDSEGGDGGREPDKFVMDRTVERVYMRKLMNDLIDVNEGEMEVMNAWNDVFMGYRSVGLKDIPRIVDQFVSEKSELLRRHPRNYALHLCGLEQAGLITPHQVLKSVTATAPAPAHEDGVTMETEPSREPLELGSDARPETLINSEVRRSVRVSLMYEAAPEDRTAISDSGATEAGPGSIEVQQEGGGRDDPIPVRVDNERNREESGTTKVTLDVMYIETTDEESDHEEEESDHEEKSRKKTKSNIAMKRLTKSLHLEEYDELMEREKIDLKILSEMDHADLRSIGVMPFGDRHRLLRKARGEIS